MRVDDHGIRHSADESAATAQDAIRACGDVHVVLPAYNEAAALPRLLRRIADADLADRITVWVVDDGSSDGTGDCVAGVRGLDVRLVRHPENLGLGQAVQTGLRAVLAEASPDDVAIVMDADDTHDPGVFPALLEQIAAGADVVICSRFVEGGDDSTAPRWRRLLSRGAAVVFGRVLRVAGVQDFTSGFRAYRVSLLRRAAAHWGERLVEERGFACMVELLMKLRHCAPVVREVPLRLRYDRKPGPSKLRLGRTLAQYLLLLMRDRLAPVPFRKL
ncbi:dolichol-phosphate mannosyltransferase [Lentzea xinjiangensis]|uniref:Dolichol-phosphate mannosyltransferase n=1 Tax=Lentzea xinjiangensis TaxID=402600 RepID=A0A1H9J1D0_9PSEU|nr:glycosyltransferase [Lentzea xinjiangensis]SEQ80547.1 dolichol-phosphate mannosyltransferase [Lentzea xinjiangensis]